MITILVANTKGGCGKTTIATGLAGAFAAAGQRTILADCDPQRSASGWARRRPETVNPVAVLDWVKELSDVPAGTTRLVIDAPAAMRMGDIEDLVRRADVVVLPVLPSAFDEGATQRFLGKLDELKPIRKHRKEVAVVGNRMRPRTRAATELDHFLADVGHKVVTRIRDSAIYADLARSGLSVFDTKSSRAAGLRADWLPLLDFISPESGV